MPSPQIHPSTAPGLRMVPLAPRLEYFHAPSTTCQYDQYKSGLRLQKQSCWGQVQPSPLMLQTVAPMLLGSIFKSSPERCKISAPFNSGSLNSIQRVIVAPLPCTTTNPIWFGVWANAVGTKANCPAPKIMSQQRQERYKRIPPTLRAMGNWFCAFRFFAELTESLAMPCRIMNYSCLLSVGNRSAGQAAKGCCAIGCACPSSAGITCVVASAFSPVPGCHSKLPLGSCIESR